MVLRALLLIAMLGPASAAAQPRSSDAAAAVVERLEAAAATGKPDAIIALGVSPDAPGLKFFSSLASPPATRVIIKERDRAALEPSGERLLIEVFTEYGQESTITTWQLDLVPGTRSPAERQIREVEQLTTVSGLYKLAINPAKEFNVRNLTITATDMTLEMASGSAFVAETAEARPRADALRTVRSSRTDADSHLQW
jgi:hypothetical protein